MSTTTIGNLSQRDAAYKALRHALILQTIRGGERLREPEWIERLGVSRTAVREAFARLEAEGLIERAPTVGYVVPTLSAEGIAEIVELRLALESAAIDRICERSINTTTHLDPLARTCDQHEEFIVQGYRLGAIEADRRFHQQLVDLSGNRRLMRMYRHAPLPLIHRLFDTSRPTQPTIKNVEDHRAILDCLKGGDAHTARQLLRRHIFAVLETLSTASVA